MSFFKNPFQKRYLPVLVCLALGVAASAITGSAFALFVMGVMAAFQWVTAGQPLSYLFVHGYIALAASCFLLVFYYLALHAVGPAIVAGALVSLPISILFTRKRA